MSTKLSSPDLAAIARQVGLSIEVIEYCCEVGLVQRQITTADLIELRRIRRLQTLDVNLAGIEVILRMRRRMVALQAEMRAMAAEMAELEARMEKDLRAWHQRLAQDG